MLTRWYGVFGWLWSLHLTLLALIPTMFFMLTKQLQPKRRYGWLLEFETVEESWLHGKFKGRWAGLNLGGVIWYSYLYSESRMTLEHERAHSLQVFIFGTWQPILYFLHSLYLLIFTRKHAYLDNYFERWARKAAQQPIDIEPEYWFDGPYDRWPWW